jgi:hypothetical protein
MQRRCQPFIFDQLSHYFTGCKGKHVLTRWAPAATSIVPCPVKPDVTTRVYSLRACSCCPSASKTCAYCTRTSPVSQSLERMASLKRPRAVMWSPCVIASMAWRRKTSWSPDAPPTVPSVAVRVSSAMATRHTLAHPPRRRPAAMVRARGVVKISVPCLGPIAVAFPPPAQARARHSLSFFIGPIA